MISFIMVPFKETITSKEELIEACKKGFEDYSNHRISKNDFCMYFGFVHGQAITSFYAGNYEQLLVDGGFNTGSSAYFAGGINAWRNLRDGKYVFPPFIQNNSKPHTTNSLHLQVIYYGAPGTGKSYSIKELTQEAEADKRVFRTTFHPDSDYATFVGCYKPTKVRKPVRDMAGNIALDKNKNEIYEESITYQFVPQAFTNAYVKAYQTTEPVYLVIEEINRGNCAQIFGDLFQLLDRDDAGYSKYPIIADTDLGNHIRERLQSVHIEGIDEAILEGQELVLPSNLYILASMNTSDQSLFPIDSAFKRRWDWKYIPIEDAGKGYTIKVNGHEYNWWTFLEAINKEVFELTNSEDKQMGYFFVRRPDGVIDAETLVSKVYFYLWNDVFKDYDLEGQKAFKKDDNKAIAFKEFFAGSKINEALAEQVLLNLGLTYTDHSEL